MIEDGREYKYSCFSDIMDDVADDADVPGAPSSPDPIMWDTLHTTKRYGKYRLCVMLPFIDRDDWTPQSIYALNARFKEEFRMTHDIRWIGLVRHGKKRNAPPDAPFYDQAGFDLAFLIHEDDTPKAGVGHRLTLGFRWFFDVIGQGDRMSMRYPRRFVQMYG